MAGGYREICRPSSPAWTMRTRVAGGKKEGQVLPPWPHPAFSPLKRQGKRRMARGIAFRPAPVRRQILWLRITQSSPDGVGTRQDPSGGKERRPTRRTSSQLDHVLHGYFPPSQRQNPLRESFDAINKPESGKHTHTLQEGVWARPGGKRRQAQETTGPVPAVLMNATQRAGSHLLKNRGRGINERSGRVPAGRIKRIASASSVMKQR